MFLVNKYNANFGYQYVTLEHTIKKRLGFHLNKTYYKNIFVARHENYVFRGYFLEVRIIMYTRRLEND